MGNEPIVMDRGESVLEFECIERDGPIVRTVKPARLSVERLRTLWENLKEFDVLFNDFVRGDVQAFVDHFIRIDAAGEPHSRGLIWDVDDVGIFFLNNIRPHDSAQAHFVFWDRIYRGREELCREMARYVFDKYKFRRIYVEWPLYANFSIQFMERIGFVNEGRKRDAILYKGEWFDVMIFSLLPEDLEKEIQDGDWRTKRRMCYECGQTYREKDKENKLMKEITDGS